MINTSIDFPTLLLYLGMSVVFSFSVYMYAINAKAGGVLKIQAKKFCLFVGVVFVILAAFRNTKVGADTAAYIHFFYNMKIRKIIWYRVISLQYTEPLYYMFTVLIRKICKSYLPYFIIIYSTILFGFYCFLLHAYEELAKSSQNQHTPILCFLPIILVSGYYLHSWNVMRNWLAISITMIAFIYLIRKKNGSAILLILVATLFHYSAIVFIAIWIAFKLDREGLILTKPIYMVIIGLSGFLVFYFGVNEINDLLSTTKYVSYADRVSNIRSVLTSLIVCIAVIVYAGDIKEQGPIAKACTMLVPIEIALLGAGLVGASRVSYYFSIPNCYLISLVYQRVPIKSENSLLRFLIRILIIMFVLVVFFNNMKHYAESSMLFPYSFVFNE